MKIRFVELLTGILVIGAALYSVIYFYNSTKKTETNHDNYSLIAKFRSIEGIKKGSDVCIAGVPVGKVTKITLDKKLFMASVSMAIPKKLKISENAKVVVRSEGLLGNKFLEINPGRSREKLKNGEEIANTQSAVSFEDLFAKMMFSNSK